MQSQEPLVQTWNGPQAWPQLPQSLTLSVRLTQRPLQHAEPVGQQPWAELGQHCPLGQHLPPQQLEPAPHAFPQPPQLRESAAVSVQQPAADVPEAAQGHPVWLSSQQMFNVLQDCVPGHLSQKNLSLTILTKHAVTAIGQVLDPV